ncbi:4366_t:CDS:2 [Gigaspora margarita]|uniref:4366_t:CDS:1 n=1 Tax=Gigaspora margarita TaxID=4874 RepID=A0ABN7UJM3_GIGMA|nr:4366_t:CDS:2 [Gigaspora margarita]
MAEISQKTGIRQKLAFTYYLQTNSLIERFNQTICKALANPFYLMYGREVILLVELEVETYPVESIADEQFWSLIATQTLKIMDNLFEARIKAQKKIHKAQLQQKCITTDSTCYKFSK